MILQRECTKPESQKAEILPPFARDKEAKVIALMNIPHTLTMDISSALSFYCVIQLDASQNAPHTANPGHAK